MGAIKLIYCIAVGRGKARVGSVRVAAILHAAAAEGFCWAWSVQPPVPSVPRRMALPIQNSQTPSSPPFLSSLKASTPPAPHEPVLSRRPSLAVYTSSVHRNKGQHSPLHPALPCPRTTKVPPA
jgi:hypothetical protein